MTSDINDLARICYEAGVDPIDYAEGELEILIGVHALVATAPPERRSGYWTDLSTRALARRILGNLLDAGWHPPVWPISEPGKRKAS